MTDTNDAGLEFLPVLSRGKHRRPRKGACFMEFASFLAGERWSDHPACTHPLLASLARLVNDYTSDEARPRLAPLIPSVIGLTGNDPHIDVHITLRCATTALPIVAVEHQHVMAVSILAAERMLDHLDGRPDGTVGAHSAWALEQAPEARRWAVKFSRGLRTSRREFLRNAAPSTVHTAVASIAHACTPEPDTTLRELLSAAIADTARWVRPAQHTEPATPRSAWSAACEITGVVGP